jgi:hypothetical protein
MNAAKSRRIEQSGLSRREIGRKNMVHGKAISCSKIDNTMSQAQLNWIVV